VGHHGVHPIPALLRPAEKFREAYAIPIEEKKQLAERIVGTGESWLSELSVEDLRAVLALSPDAVSA
jgi:hypothetical protein